MTAVDSGDDPRPRLWGLKTLLVCLLAGPLIASLVLAVLMVMFEIGLQQVSDPKLRTSLIDIAGFIVISSYVLIVPNLMFFALVGYVAYRFRRLIDRPQVWSEFQWVVLIYTLALVFTLGSGGFVPEFSARRFMVAASLAVATGLCWHLTRRWHSPPAAIAVKSPVL